MSAMTLSCADPVKAEHGHIIKGIALLQRLHAGEQVTGEKLSKCLLLRCHVFSL